MFIVPSQDHHASQSVVVCLIFVTFPSCGAVVCSPLCVRDIQCSVCRARDLFLCFLPLYSLSTSFCFHHLPAIGLTLLSPQAYEYSCSGSSNDNILERALSLVESRPSRPSVALAFSFRSSSNIACDVPPSSVSTCTPSCTKSTVAPSSTSRAPRLCCRLSGQRLSTSKTRPTKRPLAPPMRM